MKKKNKTELANLGQYKNFCSNDFSQPPTFAGRTLGRCYLYLVKRIADRARGSVAIHFNVSIRWNFFRFSFFWAIIIFCCVFFSFSFLFSRFFPFFPIRTFRSRPWPCWPSGKSVVGQRNAPSGKPQITKSIHHTLTCLWFPILALCCFVPIMFWTMIHLFRDSSP